MLPYYVERFRTWITHSLIILHLPLLTGEPALLDELLRIMLSQAQWIELTSLLLIFLVSLLVFRSLVAAYIPLVIALIGVP